MIWKFTGSSYYSNLLCVLPVRFHSCGLGTDEDEIALRTDVMEELTISRIC